MLVDMVCPFFEPSHGGVEIATSCLSRALAQTCDIRIHTLNCTSGEKICCWRIIAGDLPRREFLRGLAVFRYTFFRIPLFGFLSPSMIRAISASPSQVVHVQGLSMILNNFLLLVLNGNKAFVLTTHGLHEGLDAVRRYPFRSVVRRAIARYLSRFDLIIALSEKDKETVRSLVGDNLRVAVVPNGIDPMRFERRVPFVDRDHRRKVLCVGRFAHNKGYEDLVKALALVSQSVEFMAYFIGSVTDSSYLERIRLLIRRMGLQQAIRIGTSVSNGELADCYFSSDVFVLPSRMETLPLAILEAKYAGLPVVASRVGGIPHMIRHNVNGFLVAPKNPEELSKGILTLLLEDKIRKRFGKRNKKEFREWSDIAARTAALYRATLSRK